MNNSLGTWIKDMHRQFMNDKLLSKNMKMFTSNIYNQNVKMIFEGHLFVFEFFVCLKGRLQTQ